MGTVLCNFSQTERVPTSPCRLHGSEPVGRGAMSGLVRGVCADRLGSGLGLGLGWGRVQIYEEVIGTVKGHFGPLNALVFSPDGRR